MPELLENIYREALTLDGERQHLISLETDQSLWLKGNQQDFLQCLFQSDIQFGAIYAGQITHSYTLVSG